MSSHIPHDEHGQPVTERLNQARNHTRDVNELIGICRGIVFDDQVTAPEVVSLFKWLRSNPKLLKLWPANVIYERLLEVMRDRRLDSSEARELLDMLNGIVGGDPLINEHVDRETGEVHSGVKPTALPFSEPDLIFPNKKYVLTGKFFSGTRSECEAEIKRRGGLCLSAPTKSTHYVVVGGHGSRDWAHSNWGRKLEKAVALCEDGAGLAVVSERHWVDWLKRVRP